MYTLKIHIYTKIKIFKVNSYVYNIYNKYN